MGAESSFSLTRQAQIRQIVTTGAWGPISEIERGVAAGHCMLRSWRRGLRQQECACVRSAQWHCEWQWQARVALRTSSYVLDV
jgi:hypothetical protein